MHKRTRKQKTSGIKNKVYVQPSIPEKQIIDSNSFRNAKEIKYKMESQGHLTFYFILF
jgi:hypothetical protein